MAGISLSKNKVGALALVIAAILGIGVYWMFARSHETNRTVPQDQAQTDLGAAAPAESPQLAQARRAKGIPAVGQGMERSVKMFDEVPGETYSIQNLSGQFNKLSDQAAKGDLVAARTLYRGLGFCRHAPRDDAALYKLKQKFDANGDARAYEFQQFLYQRCGILTDEQFEQRRQLVGQLAEAGDSEARLAYPMAGQPKDFDSDSFTQERSEFKEKAKGYLNAELAQGNESALLSMALTYMPPIVQGQTVPFEVNPLMAYEYYYAYGLSATGQGKQDSAVVVLARLESQLTPEEISNARANAQTILMQCCSKR